jgi:hypothetical protein
MQKREILRIIEIISFIVWGLAILIGALSVDSDGSTMVGAFSGFIYGLGFRVLIMFVIRTIENPRRLMFFLILVPIAYLIGLIWGKDAALIGAAIGGFVAFCFIIGIIKGHDPYVF